MFVESLALSHADENLMGELLTDLTARSTNIFSCFWSKLLRIFKEQLCNWSV